MIRANYHLTEEQYTWLNAKSKKTGLSVAELIRRAVDLLREQEERKARKKEK